MAIIYKLEFIVFLYFNTGISLEYARKSFDNIFE